MVPSPLISKFFTNFNVTNILPPFIDYHGLEYRVVSSGAPSTGELIMRTVNGGQDWGRPITPYSVSQVFKAVIVDSRRENISYIEFNKELTN